MGLSRRLLFSLVGAYGALTWLLCIVLGGQFLADFDDVESKEIEKNVTQVLHAFGNTEKQLVAKTIDWAQWDVTYDFMEKRNEDYFTALVNYDTLSTLGFNHLVYVDKDGALVRGFQVFNDEGRLGDLTEDSSTHIFEHKALYSGLKTDNLKTGFLRLDDRVILVAALPILDSKRELEPRGTMIATVGVVPDFIKSVARQTNVNLVAFRLGIDRLGQEELRAVVELSSQKTPYIRPIDDTLAFGYGLIRDIRGRPILLVRVDSDRAIHQQGIRSYGLLILCLVASGIAALLASLYGMHRWVLKRILAIGQQLRVIAKTQDSSKRLSLASYKNSLVVRIALVTSVVIIPLTVALFWIYSTLLLSQYTEVERQIAVSHLQRAKLAVNQRLLELESKTVDWGQWDDTYQYVSDLNQAYVDGTLNYESLAALGVRYVVYFNASDAVLTGIRVDYDRASASPLSSDDRIFWGDRVKAVKPKDRLDRRSGIITANGETLFFASSHILDSKRSEPVKGTFLFALSLDERLVGSLSEQTRLDLSFSTISRRNQMELTAPQGDTTISIIDDEKLSASTILKDSTDRPVIDLRVTKVRTITRQGLQSLQVMAGTLLITMVLALAGVMLMMRWFVLARLRELRTEIEIISHEISGSHTVRSQGADELGSLSNDINAMLGALEKAQADLALARDAAESANAAKSSFIAKVSHELRTPIHSIIGVLRMIQKNEANEANRHYLRLARDAASGLLGTINDILDFSKAEAGMLTVSNVEMNLRDVVRDAIRTTGPRAAEKEGLELVCSYDPATPDDIIGDPIRIRQVLVNLLGNAIKFTSTGYVKLQVSAHEIDEQTSTITFSVRDSGIGIPESRLPFIFEPFRQVDDSLQRRYQGSGLGLTIVKQVVSAMGGEVRVQSEINVGSEFTVQLTTQKTKASIVNRCTALAKKNVWLLDNSDHLIQSTVTAMRRYGVEMFCLDSVTLRNWELENIDFSEAEYLIATGSALNGHRSWRLLEAFVRIKGCNSVLGLLGPMDSLARERLSDLGCKRCLLLPVVSDDIPRCLTGAYEENLAVWDAEAETVHSVLPLKILVADDISTNQMILKSLLDEAGHTVVLVNNGEELLDAVGHQIGTRPHRSGDVHFDVILTDVQMPLMDGVAATLKIREIESSLRANGGSEELPIFAVTAHAFVEERERILQAGATGVITKPIEPKQLEEVLRKIKPGESATESSAESDNIEKVDPATLTAESLRVIVDRAEKLCSTSSGFSPEIDVNAVLDRSGDSPRRCLVIFRAFLSGYGPLLESLEASSATMSAEELYHSAHSLKGILLEAGATSASEVAKQLEIRVKKGEMTDVTERAGELSRHVNKVAQVLKCIVT